MSSSVSGLILLWEYIRIAPWPILYVFTNTISTYVYWQWHLFIKLRSGKATRLHLVKHLTRWWLHTEGLWSWWNVKAAFFLPFYVICRIRDARWYTHKSSSFYPGFWNARLFRTLKKTLISQKTKWEKKRFCLDNFCDLLFLVLRMVLIFNHIMNWERNTITKVNTPIPPCKKLQKSHSAQLSSLKVRSGRRTWRYKDLQHCTSRIYLFTFQRAHSKILLWDEIAIAFIDLLCLH